MTSELDEDNVNVLTFSMEYWPLGLTEINNTRPCVCVSLCLQNWFVILIKKIDKKTQCPQHELNANNEINKWRSLAHIASSIVLNATSNQQKQHHSVKKLPNNCREIILCRYISNYTMGIQMGYVVTEFWNKIKCNKILFF